MMRSALPPPRHTRVRTSFHYPACLPAPRYSRGGLMESAFYMQLATALLPPLATLCDVEELLYFCLVSRSAKTQVHGGS